MKTLLFRFAALFISKKKIIGWGAGIVFAAAAVGAGMSTVEFKEAACSGPTQEVPADLRSPTGGK